MKGLRLPILVLIGLTSLVLPWTELGSAGIMMLCPLLLGALIYRFLPQHSVPARLLLTVLSVVGIFTIRITWQAMITNGGDWKFDNEWNLVIAGLLIQTLSGTFGFLLSLVLDTKKKSSPEGMFQTQP